MEESTAVAEAPADFSEAGIDSFLNDAPTGEDSTAEAEVQPDAEAEAQPEVEALPEIEWDGEIGEPTVVAGPNGEKLYQWNENQTRQLQQHARFATEIQTAIPDLTVDDAIVHNQAYTDLSMMFHDIRRGSPDAVQRYTDMLIREAGKSPFVGSLSASLVKHVRAADPVAYGEIKGGVEKELMDEFYRMAQQAQANPDKRIADSYKHLAQLFAYATNGGNYKTLEEYGQTAAVDPLAAREAAIQAREQAIQQQEQRAEEARTNLWKNNVGGDSGTALETEIAKQIEPYAKRYEKDPNLLKMIQGHVTNQVRAALKADREFATRFQIEYDQALSERSKDSAQRIVDRYIARARSILKAQLPKMLSSASSGAIADNRDRRNQLQRASSASHRVPGATGAPPKQSITPSPGAFKTPDDYAAFLDRL